MPEYKPKQFLNSSPLFAGVRSLATGICALVKALPIVKAGNVLFIRRIFRGREIDFIIPMLGGN